MTGDVNSAMLIPIFAYLFFMPLLIGSILMIINKKCNEYYVLTFPTFSSKIKALNQKSIYYKPHQIFQIAWENMKKTLKKRIKLLWILFALLLFISLVIWSFYLLSMFNVFLLKYPKISDDERAKIKSVAQITYIILNLLTYGLCLYLLVYCIIQSKKIHHIDEIIKTWTFDQSYLNFDKEYKPNNDLIVKNAYFTSDFEVRLSLIQKAITSKYWIRDIVDNFKNKNEAFLFSYLIIWGGEFLDNEFTLKKNYENLCQDFTNRFPNEIKLISDLNETWKIEY